MNIAKTTQSPFFVSTWVDLLGAWVNRSPGFWKWLGNVETQALANHIAGIRIEQPIYISGLARSGSTTARRNATPLLSSAPTVTASP
jgi:hypothetical protein